MKKNIYKYIIIFITAVMLASLYNYYSKNSEMDAIDKNVYQLFKTRLDNMEFIVNGDKYIFKIEKAKIGDHRRSKYLYFNRLKVSPTIYYSIYKNKNYIGSAKFQPHVRRDSLRGQFYIDNTKTALTSDIGHIYESFISLLHDKYHNNSKEVSGLNSFDESKIEYDEHGNLIKQGEVRYVVEINEKYSYSSIFTVVPNDKK